MNDQSNSISPVGRLILSIVIIILLVVLAIFLVIHFHPASNKPKSTSSSQNSSTKSKQKGTASSASSSTPSTISSSTAPATTSSPAVSNSTDLTNTGPGNVFGLASAVAVAGGTLNYVYRKTYQTRR